LIPTRMTSLETTGIAIFVEDITKKLDSTQHECVRAPGMTYCCKQVACYVFLVKALKDNNNRCPLCKEVCDHVKFPEHHPDIVIQRDQNYVVSYHRTRTIPTVLEWIEVDNQIQHDPDLGSSTSKDDDLSGYYLASDVG
jgi:hypothetical protein